MRLMSEVPSWSERLWGIDWGDHFPIRYESGVVCEKVSLERALPFIRDNYDRIFASAQRAFYPDPISEAKLRFYRETDIFLFTEDGAEMAVVIAHPTDWSTYYLRTFGILPEYQNRHFGTQWVLEITRVLGQHGVSRFESETAPANHAVIHILNKLGMMVTGSRQTECWGTLVRLTKIIDRAAEGDFVRRYCMGGWDDPRRSGLELQ
jgi:ribosomal protein S18 acetylase RimI-like enzyme